MFLRKTHVSPLRVPPCALLKEGKERDITVLKRKRLLRKEEHAHIYMNINKGYHPMKFEGSGSKGTCVIERKRFSLFGSL